MVFAFTRRAHALEAARAEHGEAEPEGFLNASWGTGRGKSHALPAFEIVGFDLLLNAYDRSTDDSGAYDVSAGSIRRNLREAWVFDNDPFDTNQFLHPYQGAMYHGFARSAGLGYWEASAYTFAGSFLWEIAGETTPPSKNDQIASGIAGSFLGEPLFRMASLLLRGGHGRPGFWRELGAAAISPPTGFNRLAGGARFDAIYPDHDPATFARFQFGGSLTALTDRGVSRSFVENEAVADFQMEYGLPGKPGYEYTRPFDYFSFQFTASSANGFENIFVRGLLVGKEYEGGDRSRGIYGLYANYDYVAPQVFRVSSTALSFGTTAQTWLRTSMPLQGTALVGLGYGAAGTIHGAGERDYHYGATPQILLAMRLSFGERLALDATARDYFVSEIASPESRGTENVARGDASLTLRLYKRQAVSFRYTYSRREATYPDLGGRNQSRGTVSAYYTFLSDRAFGAVDWPVR